jgi:hypothetical protein
MILILLYFAKNEVTYNNPQGIAIFQANEGHDYWTSDGVRNPATSPYTNSLVDN